MDWKKLGVKNFWGWNKKMKNGGTKMWWKKWGWKIFGVKKNRGEKVGGKKQNEGKNIFGVQ